MNRFDDGSVELFVEVLVEVLWDVLFDPFDRRPLQRSEELSLEEFLELLLDVFDHWLSTRCSNPRAFSGSRSPGGFAVAA